MEVSEKISQAVVSIHIVKRYEVVDYFWRRRYPVDVSFLGSGVIIDKQGCVLTNAHVVEGADTIQVVLPDGREFEGKVAGTDPAIDIALVRLVGIENEFFPFCFT